MRFLGFAVVTGAALLLGACGGGDNKTADSAAPAGDTATMTPPAGGTTTAAGTMMPITGTTHEVKMYGDATGYRFDPADITIKAGDGIKFTFVNGGPHNVAFDPTLVPAAAKAQLAANMPEQQGELSGKMLLAENEAYTISFAGVPAGTYDYFCTPHLAMNMKGKITIQ